MLPVMMFRETIGSPCRISTPPYLLAEEFETLAEIFRGAGYATAAVVSNHGWLDRSTNLDQGFQSYDVRFGIGQLLWKLPFRSLLQTTFYLGGLYPQLVNNFRLAVDVNEAAFEILAASQSSRFFLLTRLLARLDSVSSVSSF